jgi:hypothetical protein
MKTYFAKPIGRETPIKIGQSWRPAGRVNELRWGRRNCELIAVIDANVEGRLHARFADWHEGKEWFTVNPELLDFIRAVQAYNDLLDGLPPPRRLTPNGGVRVAHIGKYAAFEVAP